MQVLLFEVVVAHISEPCTRLGLCKEQTRCILSQLAQSFLPREKRESGFATHRIRLEIHSVAKLAPGRELPTGQAAMPPVENRWTKKRKAEEEAAVVPAANVVVQFQSDAGEKAGEIQL